MSASKKKQLRQESMGDMTPRQRREIAEGRKAKRNKIVYSIIGAVAVVSVAALLIWDSGILRGNPVAATVNGQAFTASQVAYYYGNVRQQQMQYASIYQQLGMVGYDSTKPADQQIQEESSGKTFAQFFAEESLAQLKQVTLLNDQAAAEGYVLSDEGKEIVKENLDAFKTYAAQSGMSYKGYLKAMFGKLMDQKTLEGELTRAVLADEFSRHKNESFTYTDAEIEDYYKENADTMDTYDYRYARIDGAPLESTDAEGTVIDPTEAEIAAAMSQAKIKAEALSNEIKAGADFNTAAAKYASDVEKDFFLDDPEHNHEDSALGSSISGAYTQWLTTTAKAGDINTVEDTSGSAYYVVQLLNRWRAEDTYATVDARHILIKAELDEGATAPTEEQYAAAKTQIEDIKAQWEAGDKTAESFAALAQQHSEDPGSKEEGGLYEDITPNYMVPPFNDFIFAPGRQVGDVGVVQNTESGQQGYHLIYMDALGEIAWKGTALGTLRGDAYSEWYTGIEETYEAEVVDEGMNLLAK